MSFTDRVQCDLPADWLSMPSQCYYEWQTLAAAMLALLGAWLTVKKVTAQMGQADAHRADDITRRHAAAKISMPLALSGLSGIVDSIADEIATELESYDDEFNRQLDAILDGRADRHRFEPVTIPQNTIDAFSGFAETLSNANDLKHVAELIATVQVLVARYNGQDLRRAGARLNLESLLLDAATLKVLIDCMFNYARNLDQRPFGIVDVVPAGEAWTRIRQAAHGLVFLRQQPDRFLVSINQRVERYRENGTSPWLEKFQP